MIMSRPGCPRNPSVTSCLPLQKLFYSRWWDNCLPAFLTDTLLIDYQFTFSLSQEDDRYYTAINFVATPEEVHFLFSLLTLSFVFSWPWRQWIVTVLLVFRFCLVIWKVCPAPWSKQSFLTLAWLCSHKLSQKNFIKNHIWLFPVVGATSGPF